MADTTIRWTTPKGTPVVLELRTTKEINLDGHKSMVSDYTLALTAGTYYGTAPTIETHPTAGMCLRIGHILIPVVAAVSDAVTALVAEYHTEMDRRNAEWVKGEREYEAHTARMRRAMDTE